MHIRTNAGVRDLTPNLRWYENPGGSNLLAILAPPPPMIPLVRQWTCLHWNRPVKSRRSPSNFRTWIGPIPNLSRPGMNSPGLLWTSPVQCRGLGYFFNVSVF